MNKKIRTLLASKCKDFGLTDKALDELASLGSEGISDESSEDDISAKVDSLIPYARMMQGEITRKTQKRTQSINAQSDTDGARDGEDVKDGKGGEIPAWVESYMKPFKESLKELQNENASLKAEKAAGERKSLISSKAKELGIPDYLMKRYTIADDVDIDAELTSFKQELVSNNLMPKDAATEVGNVEESYKADAQSWAESLPNK